MGDTVPRIKNDAGGAARCVKRENCLDRDMERRRVERLEHDLCHLLAIGLGIERGLGKENGMLFGSYAKLVVERVVPNFLPEDSK